MKRTITTVPNIPHRLPSERINQRFDPMHSGESIRSEVVF